MREGRSCERGFPGFRNRQHCCTAVIFALPKLLSVCFSVLPDGLLLPPFVAASVCSTLGGLPLGGSACMVSLSAGAWLGPVW
jgi:hypothetical protein